MGQDWYREKRDSKTVVYGEGPGGYAYLVQAGPQAKKNKAGKVQYG